MSQWRRHYVVDDGCRRGAPVACSEYPAPDGVPLFTARQTTRAGAASGYAATKLAASTAAVTTTLPQGPPQEAGRQCVPGRGNLGADAGLPRALVKRDQARSLSAGDEGEAGWDFSSEPKSVDMCLYVANKQHARHLLRIPALAHSGLARNRCTQNSFYAIFIYNSTVTDGMNILSQ